MNDQHPLVRKSDRNLPIRINFFHAKIRNTPYTQNQQNFFTSEFLRETAWRPTQLAW